MSNARTTHSIAIVSALLGLGAFIAVVVFAPVDTPRGRRSAAPNTPRLDQSIQSIRTALVDGRSIASVNIAQNVVSKHPDEPDAWMWLAIVADRFGDPITAMDAAQRQLELLSDPDRAAREGRSSFTAGSEHAYRVAWGHRVLGDTATARTNFAKAADLLEEESGAGETQFAQYNLACYRAMAGQHDRAADHFARAVEAGYGRDNGWWQTDPDLDPIRAHPVFVAAAERLEERARAARAEPRPVPSAEPETSPAESDPGG
jgi:tetratricopeptide (TPR) repeat protein